MAMAFFERTGTGGTIAVNPALVAYLQEMKSGSGGTMIYFAAASTGDKGSQIPLRVRVADEIRAVAQSLEAAS